MGTPEKSDITTDLVQMECIVAKNEVATDDFHDVIIEFDSV